MKRFLTLMTALMLVVAGMAVTESSAEAGLFNRNDCCKPEKCRQGLFAKRKAKRAANNCCEPAPCGCEPVTTCGCEAPACGCEAPACGCGEIPMEGAAPEAPEAPEAPTT